MSIQLQEISAIYMHQQRIEYLQSTGDYMQYIDTGVKIDSATAFVGTTIDFQIVSIDRNLSDSSIVAGSVLSEGTYSYNNTECMVYLGIFYKDGGFDFSQYSNIYARTIATSNGNVKGISNLNLLLFGRNVKGIGVNCQGSCRIFSCTIRKNGDVIRDFIPVRVGNKGYMYDNITKQLYGNAGTGDFVLGQDVGAPLHQIYKNKLVEGEDYMVGEWLKGDAVAYINTNYLLDFDDIKTSVFRLYNTNNQTVEGTRYGNVANGAGTVFGYATNNVYGSFFSPNGEMAGWDNNIPINVESTVVMSKNGITLNGSAVASTSDTPIVGSRFKSVTPYLIFASWINKWQIDGRRQKVDYKSFEIEGKLHLVPCKLLRSIPRNLDAQCKARVAGECGMIDLISGRFYGNVASSGAFSLEWDEWLKDCSIQIAIPSCYAFNYTTRVDTTKLTSELVDFGFIKLSNTQIVYGDEDDGYVYTVDWGTNKWATLGINIMSDWGTVSITINGTTGTTFSNVPLDLNPHIYLYDIMQIKQIKWTIMSPTTTTTILTRYVDETTGQQGLISDQDGTIIYAD